MKVILLENIDKLGAANEVVTVKDGYGRNYLIPQHKAMIASNSNLKGLEERKRQYSMKVDKELALVKEVADKLKATTIKVPAKVGTTDKIFGSITNVQLAEIIMKESGVELDRKKIIIQEDIKTTGNYTAKIQLHPSLEVELPFEVVAEA